MINLTKSPGPFDCRLRDGEWPEKLFEMCKRLTKGTTA